MNEADDLLQRIKTQLESMPDFGQVQIFVKKHVGEFGKTDIVKMTSYRYSNKEQAAGYSLANVSCTSDVLKLIKNVTDAGLTGTLSFSIAFKNGECDLMQVQDFRKL